MTRILKLLVWLVLGACLTACSENFEFHDTNGNVIEFEKFQGEFLVLNYWAKWCKPCLEEIPELNLLAAEQGDKLSVIGVNFDILPVPELTAQVLSFGIDYPVVTADPADYLNLDKPEVLPTTYVLNSDLQLVKVLVGPQTRQSILQVLDNS